MEYFDLGAALLGVCSSLFLGLPLLHEVRVSKRFLMLLNQIEKNMDSVALEGIRQHFINEKMAAYARFESYASIGFFLLFLSFLLTMAAALVRMKLV